MIYNNQGFIHYYLSWRWNWKSDSGGGICLLRPGNSSSANAERKLVQQKKERLAVYETSKALGDSDNDASSERKFSSPSIISFLCYFSFSFAVIFLAGPLSNSGPFSSVTVENMNKFYTKQNSVRNFKSPTKQTVACNVGRASYQPTPIPPLEESFLDCYWLDEQERKCFYPKNRNTNRVEGHELQHVVEQQESPSDHRMVMEVVQ